jgi:hypothetical protein
VSSAQQIQADGRTRFHIAARPTDCQNKFHQPNLLQPLSFCMFNENPHPEAYL